LVLKAGNTIIEIDCWQKGTGLTIKWSLLQKFTYAKTTCCKFY